LTIAGLIAIAALGSLWWLWDWNWFRALLEARLSAVVGRGVTIDRVELHPGRSTVLSMYGVTAANPAGYRSQNSAIIDRVTIGFDAETWLRSRRVVIPSIELERPEVDFEENGSGKSNWDLAGTWPSVTPEIDRQPADPRRHRACSHGEAAGRRDLEDFNPG
jgi:AsmA family protein